MVATAVLAKRPPSASDRLSGKNQLPFASPFCDCVSISQSRISKLKRKREDDQETILQAGERAIVESVGTVLEYWCPSNCPWSIDMLQYDDEKQQEQHDVFDGYTIDDDGTAAEEDTANSTGVVCCCCCSSAVVKFLCCDSFVINIISIVS